MSILQKTFMTLLFLWGCLVAYNAKADDLKYLAHGEESLSGLYRLAESAQKTLELSTFIFEPCHGSAQALMDVLAARAKAGVKVRLLMDAMGHSSKQRQDIVNSLAQSGIQVRFYNDSFLVDPGNNLRLHSKFMIVDGAAYITGGRNISDEYFGMSAKQNWLDRDVYVYGASAIQAVKYFNELWNSDMTKVRTAKPADFKGWPKFCGTDLSKQGPAVHAFVNTKGNDILNRIPSRNCASVKFTSDAPDFGHPMYSEGSIYDDPYNAGNDSYMSKPRLSRKRTTLALLQFIDGAKSRLAVENWGYLPIGYLRQSFADLRARNVKIDGWVNQDMESGPKFFQQAEEWAIAWISGDDSVGSQSIRLVSSLGKLKDNNDLSLPNARFFLHGKVLVRDTQDAVVSSFNLDARSYSTNLETAVVVKNCPAFAGDVLREIHKVNDIYVDDSDSGRIPEKEEAGFFSKMFAWINLSLF